MDMSKFDWISRQLAELHSELDMPSDPGDVDSLRKKVAELSKLMLELVTLTRNGLTEMGVQA
jgi:hypothetical protein